MAWIYLAGSEETPSHLASGLKRSLTVNVTDTLNLCCFHKWPMETLSKPQFGMTLQRSRDQCSISLSTSLSQVSHARTLALQVRVRDWQESEAVFFSKSCAWPKKSSPRSYSLKTSQQSEHADWTQLSRNLPKQGMTVDGLCFPLQMWVQNTKGKDGSALLPTPSSVNYGSNQGGAAGRVGKKRYSLESMARHNLWPTPAANESGRTLAQFRENKTRETKLGGMGLSIAVQISEAVIGKLNPTWVEWLMGFPLEWTELSALVMPWYRSKRGKRSNI